MGSRSLISQCTALRRKMMLGLAGVLDDGSAGLSAWSSSGARRRLVN